MDKNIILNILRHDYRGNFGILGAHEMQARKPYIVTLERRTIESAAISYLVLSHFFTT